MPGRARQSGGSERSFRVLSLCRPLTFQRSLHALLTFHFKGRDGDSDGQYASTVHVSVVANQCSLHYRLHASAMTGAAPVPVPPPMPVGVS